MKQSILALYYLTETDIGFSVCFFLITIQILKLAGAVRLVVYGIRVPTIPWYDFEKYIFLV